MRQKLSLKKKPRNRTQARRFIKPAREAGASEDECEFDENLRRIAKANVVPEDESTGRKAG